MRRSVRDLVSTSPLRVAVVIFVLCGIGGALYAADPFDLRAELSEDQIESIEQSITERYDIAAVEPVTRDGLSALPESDRKAWDRIVLADPATSGPEDTVPQGVWVTFPGEEGQRRHLYVLGGDPLAGKPVLKAAPEAVTFSNGPDQPPSGQKVDEPDPASFERNGQG